ncbi:sigma-54-dependent transcriptional regulator [Zooshikella ganghwensis]|uniref:Sigma-54-dependent Fis family transcriptional regulator n=1 Tax=Zooshikella ganghwensis TaxID=202772 RepID=A0A4P9VTV2_9GAMM|nr:sigma-54 dependent transcriptional regulator [Zooshikella ganghwensis]RDH45470.1 sigma-54-dependent Fis family transcriptional regulator [Zooshikella ganghwensis]
MNNPKVLIVDDEPDIRELLEITLGRMRLNTLAVDSVSSAKSALAEDTYNLCLTDMNLPDGNGIDLVKHISQHYSDMPVAMITAYGSMDTAIEALKAGAFDFVSKPIDLQRLRELINNALQLVTPIADTTINKQTQLLGQSAVMIQLGKQIIKLARSQAPVYISGESGTGKEMVARLIHEQGPRADQPFIPVNCGAIPSELMESEFFGHKKGSFTGATNDKEGLFQSADGGTLFLDEVADLPAPMQVKLLRAIQEKAIRPVGSQQELKTNTRILSATHKDLAEMVANGQFRQDLFYRINVIELNVPPLRERQEDILLLANFFLRQLAESCQTPPPHLTPEAEKALLAYNFPGNVRELENILERAFTLCEADEISASDLKLNVDSATPATSITPDSDQQSVTTESPIPLDGSQSLEDYLAELERKAIVQALEESRWNKTAAAKKLGITFRALRYRLKKLGLD